MISALRTAATGMYAQELSVEVISNNLANINTTGFKRSKVEFQDLLYQTIESAGTENDVSNATNADIQVGHGTKPVAVLKLFSQGDVNPTNNPLDLAIDGNGFFQILSPDGNILFTRDGTFKLSADGQIVTSDGLPLQPSLSIPADTEQIHISTEGIISVLTVGSDAPEEIGQFDLAKFVNPAGLKSLGRNLYAQTVSSGEPQFGTPDSEGYGRLMQGYLELSNVDVVEEMINLIVAQRAYEINSKAIKTSEEMLSMANNLSR
jgi:flagellar basal-body rod protein FlgG